MGTDDAGQSSVLASVHPVLDPSMEPLVRDSVGQTTSLPAVGLGNSIEEDGRVRPRSVNLLGDSRVIDSKEPEGSEIRTEESQYRPGDISGRREEIMVQSLRKPETAEEPLLFPSLPERPPPCFRLPHPLLPLLPLLLPPELVPEPDCLRWRLPRART